MKIVILNTQAPFVQGGAEYLANGLHIKLVERGHQVETVGIPFKWYPSENIPHHIMASRLLELDQSNIDLLIGLKFPTYFIPFENKKIWLVHQFRQAYELWGTEYQEFPNTPAGLALRDLVHRADNRYLPEAKAIYTISKIVARRLKTYSNIEAKAVLYAPLINPEQFHSGEFRDYFFYPSRLVTVKRQETAIEAMRYVKSNFTLVLAGKADNDRYQAHLEQLVDRYDLRDRIKVLGFISDEQKIQLMANAFAALYIPYDEDSYGYVTLEAFHSSKPVITFSDSGGTDEIIEHERNGLILEPTPQALAKGMEKLWANKQNTIDMGKAAHETLERLQIHWDHVLDNLLS